MHTHLKSLTKKPKKNSCLLLMMKINQIAENWVKFFISRWRFHRFDCHEEFRFPLTSKEKEKLKTQIFDYPIPFDYEDKIDLAHNILIQKHMKNGNLSKQTKKYLLQRKSDNKLTPTVRSKFFFWSSLHNETAACT